MTNPRQFVESLSRGFRILSIICESNTPLRLSDLADESGLTISTMQRLTYTLQEIGMIDRDPNTKRFRIGPKMITMALAVKQNLELRKVARPFMQQTSDAIGEVVGLSVLSGLEIVLIEIIKINHQVLNINMDIGTSIPPHATSGGKAILAFLDESQANKILRHSHMTKFTKNTITSVKSYHNQLKKVRECGYSLAINENAIGLSAIAAPVRNSDGAVIAAISVMVPSARISKEKLASSFSKKAIQTADKISKALGYRNSNT
jgi:DNA-binding IclR family transcriptional regulator